MTDRLSPIYGHPVLRGSEEKGTKIRRNKIPEEMSKGRFMSGRIVPPTGHSATNMNAHTPTSSHAANSKRALLIRRNVTSGVPWAQIFYFINRLYSHSARRTPLDQNKSNCFDNFFYFVTYKKPKTLKS